MLCYPAPEASVKSNEIIQPEAGIEPRLSVVDANTYK